MQQHNEKSLRELLKRHDLWLNKAIGQNFLVDASIPATIAGASGIDRSCGVLEVGPGAGALTAKLSDNAGKVLAVELDRRLLPVLDETLAGLSNVEIKQGDILKLDITALVERKMPGMRYICCSNLPYSITTPVLTKLIESGVFESVTVMVQSEVAKRICSDPGSRDYGAFTVFIDYHCPVKSILFDVPPECFVPRPGVLSSVVKLVVRGGRLLSPDGERMLFSVVRAAFMQRRKTLVNALYSAFGRDLSKGGIIEVVKKCGFDVNVRGERLGLEEFIKLSGFLKKN